MIICLIGTVSRRKNRHFMNMLSAKSMYPATQVKSVYRLLGLFIKQKTHALDNLTVLSTYIV